MFTTVQLLILLAAIAGSGCMVAVLAWIFGRIRRLEAGDRGSGDPAELAAQVRDLEAELETTQREVARLGEQVGFTQKLLETRSDPGADESHPGY